MTDSEVCVLNVSRMLCVFLCPVRILRTFVSQQWKLLSNDLIRAQQKKRHSWFKAGGTIKKFRAGLSIFSPVAKYCSTQTDTSVIISALHELS